MAEFNMLEIPISKFVTYIREDFEDENYGPAICLGKAGVGKTVSMHELAQEMGIGYKELRLVTMTEIDILGLPDTEVMYDNNGNVIKGNNGRERKATTYSASALLPVAERDGERGILVLDEITSASRGVRACAYQLLDSKRALGEYKLPDKWKVVALGNGSEDGGVFEGMESAFLNRGSTCYRVEPDLDGWKEWAIKHGVHPTVIAFLTQQPDCIHQFDNQEIASVFPSPRSWEALSTKLTKRERARGGRLDIDDVENYAGGAIGAKVAAMFASFYAYSSEVIDCEDIFAGKIKASDMQNLSGEALIITIQSVIKNLAEILKKHKKGADSFDKPALQAAVAVARWIIEISKVRIDDAMIAITDLTKGVPDFTMLIVCTDEFDTLCPDFIEFCVANGATFSAY